MILTNISINVSNLCQILRINFIPRWRDLYWHFHLECRNNNRHVQKSSAMSDSFPRNLNCFPNNTSDTIPQSDIESRDARQAAALRRSIPHQL